MTTLDEYFAGRYTPQEYANVILNQTIDRENEANDTLRKWAKAVTANYGYSWERGLAGCTCVHCDQSIMEGEYYPDLNQDRIQHAEGCLVLECRQWLAENTERD